MPTLLMCPHRSDLESLIRFHGVPEGSLHNAETVIGAAAGVYASRVARFREAMQRHQRAIDDHSRATHPGAPKTFSSRATRETLLRSGAISAGCSATNSRW